MRPPAVPVRLAANQGRRFGDELVAKLSPQ